MKWIGPAPSEHGRAARSGDSVRTGEHSEIELIHEPLLALRRYGYVPLVCGGIVDRVKRGMGEKVGVVCDIVEEIVGVEIQRAYGGNKAVALMKRDYIAIWGFGAVHLGHGGS
jgi:hypothetical protein